MYATLVGTNTKSEAYIQIFDVLVQVAKKQGFIPGDLELRIEPDQIPLHG